MNKELYDTPPSDEVFDEVKREAIKIWQTYDDTYGYASEKIKRVESIENHGDNVMYIIAMFDTSNMVKLAKLLSDDTKKEIYERLESVESPEALIFYTRIHE
jgi:hypothetical protein